MAGLEIRCYLDPASCRDYREDGGQDGNPSAPSGHLPLHKGGLGRGYCVRHCRRCSDVHEPGVWEDGQDKEGAD